MICAFLACVMSNATYLLKWSTVIHPGIVYPFKYHYKKINSENFPSIFRIMVIVIRFL